MKSSILKLTGLAALALAVAFAGPVFAQGDEEGPGGGKKKEGDRRGGERGERGGRGGPPAIIKALDADGDKKISKEEIENAVEALKSLDKNDDGELTPEEFMGRRGPGGPGGKRGGGKGKGKKDE